MEKNRELREIIKLEKEKIKRMEKQLEALDLLSQFVDEEGRPCFSVAGFFVEVNYKINTKQ